MICIQVLNAVQKCQRRERVFKGLVVVALKMSSCVWVRGSSALSSDMEHSLSLRQSYCSSVSFIVNTLKSKSYCRVFSINASCNYLASGLGLEVSWRPVLLHQPPLAMDSGAGRAQQVQSLTAQQRGIVHFCTAFAGTSHKIIQCLLFSGELFPFLITGTKVRGERGYYAYH